MEGLKKVRNVAEQLKSKGITVNVIYEKNLAFRIGKEAKPGLLALFGDIEIVDLKKTAEIFNLLF